MTKRSAHYGKIGLASLSSEVKAIWYSRHIEPEPCEPIDSWWPTQTDLDLELKQDFARRLVTFTVLTKREEQVVIMCVLDNCTLREAGEVMGCSNSRARQILMKAMRKFRLIHNHGMGTTERNGKKRNLVPLAKQRKKGTERNTLL